MFRKELLILFVILTAGCATQTTSYKVTNYFIDRNAFGDIRSRRVAVLPFRNTAGSYSAAEGATEEFNLQLGKTGYFTLVERLRIQEIFKEQDFDPRRIDEATAVRIGKMLGAHGVVLGTLNDYQSGKVGISVRLVSVEKGSQVWQAKDTFFADNPKIQALVDVSERRRLKEDPEFLLQVLCQEIVKTLLSL